MTTRTTLTATLTPSQKQNWEAANWGAFTRSGNIKVAKTVIAMLEEGIDTNLIWEEYYDLMDIVAERSGVDEVTDSDARDSVCWVLERVLGGSIPTLRVDFHKEEDDEDEWEE